MIFIIDDQTDDGEGEDREMSLSKKKEEGNCSEQLVDLGVQEIFQSSSKNQLYISRVIYVLMTLHRMIPWDQKMPLELFHHPNQRGLSSESTLLRLVPGLVFIVF